MGTPVGSRLMANGLSTQAHSRSMGKKAAVPTGCLCRALVLLGNFASLSPNIHQVPREAAGLNPHSRNLKLLCAGTYASRQGSGPLSPKASNVEEGGVKVFYSLNTPYTLGRTKLGLASALPPT